MVLAQSDSVHAVGAGRYIVPDSSTGDHDEAVGLVKRRKECGLVKRRKERYHEASQPRMQVGEKLKLWTYLDAENMFPLLEKSSDLWIQKSNFSPKYRSSDECSQTYTTCVFVRVCDF